MKLMDWLGSQSLPICNFTVSGIDEPNKSWEKLEGVFGKHNEIWGHQLKNELISLNLNDFYYIQAYLSKYKTLRLLYA